MHSLAKVTNKIIRLIQHTAEQSVAGLNFVRTETFRRSRVEDLMH